MKTLKLTEREYETLRLALNEARGQWNSQWTDTDNRKEAAPYLALLKRLDRLFDKIDSAEVNPLDAKERTHR